MIALGLAGATGLGAVAIDSAAAMHPLGDTASVAASVATRAATAASTPCFIQPFADRWASDSGLLPTCGSADRRAVTLTRHVVQPNEAPSPRSCFMTPVWWDVAIDGPRSLC